MYGYRVDKIPNVLLSSCLGERGNLTPNAQENSNAWSESCVARAKSRVSLQLDDVQPDHGLADVLGNVRWTRFQHVGLASLSDYGFLLAVGIGKLECASLQWANDTGRG